MKCYSLWFVLDIGYVCIHILCWMLTHTLLLFVLEISSDT